MKKVIEISPILLLVVIEVFTLINIYVYKSAKPYPEHYIAIVCLLINFIVYLKNYKAGLLFTGLVLVLATFNLMSFFAQIKYNKLSFFVKINNEKVQISTPEVRMEIIFILIAYIILNRKMLVSTYNSILGKDKNL